MSERMGVWCGLVWCGVVVWCMVVCGVVCEGVVSRVHGKRAPRDRESAWPMAFMVCVAVWAELCNGACVAVVQRMLLLSRRDPV